MGPLYPRCNPPAIPRPRGPAMGVPPPDPGPSQTTSRGDCMWRSCGEGAADGSPSLACKRRVNIAFQDILTRTACSRGPTRCHRIRQSVAFPGKTVVASSGMRRTHDAPAGCPSRDDSTCLPSMPCGHRRPLRVLVWPLHFCQYSDLHSVDGQMGPCGRMRGREAWARRDAQPWTYERRGKNHDDHHESD